MLPVLIIFIMLGQAASAAPPSRTIETEVLYSWQSLPSVLEWAATTPRSGLFKANYLYAWRTPAATFAYDDLPIRIKLKKGIGFKGIGRDERDCRKLDPVLSAETVYVSKINDSMTDYLLCSKEVIHSWSFGTQEAMDEVRNDLQYSLDHPGQGDYYGYYDPKDCSECVLGQVDDQPRRRWNLNELLKKIEFLSLLSKTSLPRVFCMQESETECSNKHFSFAEAPYFVSAMNNHSYTDRPFSLIQAATLELNVEDTLVLRDMEPEWTKALLANTPSLKLNPVSVADLLVIVGKDEKQRGAVISTDPRFNTLDLTNFAFSDDKNDLKPTDSVMAPEGRLLFYYLVKAKAALLVSKFDETLGNAYRKIVVRARPGELAMKQGLPKLALYELVNEICYRLEIDNMKVRKSVSVTYCEMNR